MPKQNSLRDFIRPRHSLERTLVADVLAVGAVDFPCDALRVDEAGSDGVYEDVVRGQSLSQRLAHRIQAGLARAVSRGVGFASERAARRNVSDLPAALFDHLLSRAKSQIRRSDQVGVDRGPPRLLPFNITDRRDRMGLEDRGVVDQRVQTAEIADNMLDQFARLIGVSDVGSNDRVRTTLKQSERLFGLLAIVVVMNDHSRSVFGELQRGRAADALRSAGSLFEFVFEFHASPDSQLRITSTLIPAVEIVWGRHTTRQAACPGVADVNQSIGLGIG